jgi:HAD superfamily hydrolase (TIGR01509 family)
MPPDPEPRSTTTAPQFTAALIDVDGTLVDTNYLHLMAWSRALREGGEWVPMHVIHRCIGMGADQLLPQLIGREDHAIAEAHDRHFGELFGEAVAFPSAATLVRRLVDSGVTVVLATSSSAEQLDAALRLLGLQDLHLPQVTGDDIKRSKPDPEIVRKALEVAGVDAADAVVIGDSEWDVRAATAAGVASVLVQTSAPWSHPGATPIAEYDALEQLLGHLSQHGLGGWPAMRGAGSGIVDDPGADDAYGPVRGFDPARPEGSQVRA